MVDEIDSNDVIGMKDVVLFDLGMFGCGIVKIGFGCMMFFQFVYFGGWSFGESDGVDVVIMVFGIMDQGLWELLIDENVVVVDEDFGLNDQQ